MTTVLERLNFALHHSMEVDPRIYNLGEDILDPYGGAFKVSRGLSTAFPNRVITTPISEAAITGIASGMAMRGLRPVVEIMFGDFVSLIADQLINHAAKFRWMYNDGVRVPIVIRTPMGGRRGYGPTHSQSLEKLFLGIPGIKVVAPNTLGDPAELLEASIADDDPVVFIEHKLLYTCPLLVQGTEGLADFTVTQTNDPYPIFLLQNAAYQPRLTIATYGYNFELVRAAALDLMMDFEIFSDIVVFSQLSPFCVNPVLESLSRTRRLLTVEEGTLGLGWGSEILARALERNELEKTFQARRVAARDLPIATARSLEDAILPSKNDIVQAGLALVEK
jgi:pyruvate/2-oxoglutarate/acetoin dehydrogenase E1 component